MLLFIAMTVLCVGVLTGVTVLFVTLDKNDKLFFGAYALCIIILITVILY